jgi:hypothetical protein
MDLMEMSRMLSPLHPFSIHSLSVHLSFHLSDYKSDHLPISTYNLSGNDIDVEGLADAFHELNLGLKGVS